MLWTSRRGEVVLGQWFHLSLVWRSNSSQVAVYMANSFGKDVRRLTTQSVTRAQNKGKTDEKICAEWHAPLATVGGCQATPGARSTQPTGSEPPIVVDLLAADLYMVGVALSAEKLKPMPMALRMYSSLY